MLELLSDIKEKLEQGEFQSERAVELQLVPRVLGKLGWDRDNPSQVKPQYKLKWERNEKRKKVEQTGIVDFALLINGKARVFIEVKDVGKIEEGALQIRDYMYAEERVPLAVLTDGQKWRIYYPFHPEQIVRTLDILEHRLDEVAEYLSRYLAFEEVKSKRAENNANKDLQDKTNREAAKQAIPEAWLKIVNDKPDELVDHLINEVTQETSGIAPNRDDVIKFLKNLKPSEAYSPPQAPVKSQRTTYKAPRKSSKNPVSYTLLGKTEHAPSPIQAYVDIIDNLARRDPNFLDRLSLTSKFGETQLSRHTEFPNSSPIHGGWYLNRDFGGQKQEDRLKVACRVAGIEFGRDLIFDSPTPAERHAPPQESAESQRAVYKPRPTPPKRGGRGQPATYILFGVKKTCPNATQAYLEIMDMLARRDSNFLNRLNDELNNARFLSRDKSKMIRPKQINDGWYLDTNINNPDKIKRLKTACEVAGVEFGRDLIVDFPNA